MVQGVNYTSNHRGGLIKKQQIKFKTIILFLVLFLVRHLPTSRKTNTGLDSASWSYWLGLG
jgi:hypothetical protein